MRVFGERLRKDLVLLVDVLALFLQIPEGGTD